MHLVTSHSGGTLPLTASALTHAEAVVFWRALVLRPRRLRLFGGERVDVPREEHPHPAADPRPLERHTASVSEPAHAGFGPVEAPSCLGYGEEFFPRMLRSRNGHERQIHHLTVALLVDGQFIFGVARHRASTRLRAAWCTPA